VAAHRVSDAFRKIAPEKYGDFHRTLLGGREHANEAVALAVAADLGVTETQIRAKMAEAGNEASVRETYGIAEALGVSGTPSYVVGSEAIFGAIGAEAIKTKVANVQSCGKTIC
jgi:protein-disulfide isomerase